MIDIGLLPQVFHDDKQTVLLFHRHLFSKIVEFSGVSADGKARSLPPACCFPGRCMTLLCYVGLLADRYSMVTSSLTEVALGVREEVEVIWVLAL